MRADGIKKTTELINEVHGSRTGDTEERDTQTPRISSANKHSSRKKTAVTRQRARILNDRRAAAICGTFLW